MSVTAIAAPKSITAVVAHSLVLATLWVCSGLSHAQAIEDDWQGVSRIVAIGDIHGDYQNYITVLKEAGVVNKRGKWAAGKTHVVQVGDIPDRGPDTLKIIEHLQKLEKQAAKAGGYLHLLIGNHEYMNVSGDLRYVHPGEYGAFETRQSKKIRDNYYAYVVKTLESQRDNQAANDTAPAPLPVADKAFKSDWYATHPLGFVEHRLAWQPGGEMANWVSQHNTVIRINDVLFLHGGLSADLLPLSMTDINEQIRAELRGEPVDGEPLGTASHSPLWYRGLARNSETVERPVLDAVLEHFGAKMVVLGHTPDLNVITPRFDGEVVVIDTGISAYYGGHRASLLIENGDASAIHEAKTHKLPVSAQGMIPYFESLAEQFPKNARLQAHVGALSNISTQSDKDDLTTTERTERAVTTGN
jgi:hypothetical protein